MKKHHYYLLPLFYGLGVCSAVFFASELLAEESSFRKVINCQEYLAKIENVPIFAGPNENSEILEYLETQEKVCVVGERAEFFILDWKNQDLVNDLIVQQKRVPEVAYVKKDKVKAAQPLQEDVYERAQRQMHRMRSGVVPEDIYGPFRPVIDFFHPPTKCLAGEEICERVKQLQKDNESQEPVAGSEGKEKKRE